MINLYQCSCPNNSRADPTSCPNDCPNIDRYKDIVPSDQVRGEWRDGVRVRVEESVRAVMP